MVIYSHNKLVMTKARVAEFERTIHLTDLTLRWGFLLGKDELC